jgi:6-phosphogluconolactonase
MSATPEVQVLSDNQQWSAQAAALTLDVQRQAVQERGRFLIALSGGRTPEQLYHRLSSRACAVSEEWSSTLFFFSDERCVPPDHPESNYRLAEQALFRPLNIPQDRIHRMRGEHPDPPAAAREYEDVLRAAAKAEHMPWPQLDLVMLGVGNDGHTASLFPGTDALHEHQRWVTVGHAPSNPPTRLTLTLGVINQATVVLFLASGESKSDIIKRILEPQQESNRQLPAALVRPERGRLIWLLDRAAAAKLTGSHTESYERPR